MKFFKKAAAVLLSAVLAAAAVVVPPEKAPALLKGLMGSVQEETLFADAAESGYSIRYWVTDTITEVCGEQVSVYHRNVPYYFCFEVYNKETGVPDEEKDFKLEISLTDPSGEELASAEYQSKKDYYYTYNDQKINHKGTSGWVKFTPQSIGDVALKLTISGELSGTFERTYNVKKPHVNLHVWVSDSAWGTTPSAFALGTKYYLCSELTDLDTGERLDYHVGGYTETSTIYDPAGGVKNTVTREETDSRRTYDWIAHTCGTAGIWKGTLKLEGDIEYELSVTWNVTDPSVTVTTTAPSVTETSAGTTSPSVTTQPAFSWGEDNWNFSNNSTSFPEGYAVDPAVIDKLCTDFKFTNIEREIMKYRCSRSQYTSWGGSCFGMTASEIFVKQGLLDLSQYGGVSTVNGNSASKAMISLINFVQNIQNVPYYAQIMRFNSMLTVPASVPQYDYIDDIIDAVVNDGHIVSLGYAIRTEHTVDDRVVSSTGGHAVLAYGVEDCDYTDKTTGLTYDRRVLIADPNRLGKNMLTDECCLYFRSDDHSWVIPYQNYTYTSGGVEYTSSCYWNAGCAYNEHGFLRRIIRFASKRNVSDLAMTGEMNEKMKGRYLPGLALFTPAAAPRFNKVEGTGNPAYDAIGGNQTAIAYFNDGAPSADQLEHFRSFVNETASYEMIYSSPQNFDFIMDYPDFAYISEVQNGTYALFAPDGFVGLKGSDMSYKMSMTENESTSKTTDWYTVIIEGSGASRVSLDATKGRYYFLESDDLHDISVIAYNDDDTATLNFSTDYTKVMLVEDSATVIVAKADPDGDGVFDQTIAKSGAEVTPVTSTTTSTATTTVTTTTTTAAAASSTTTTAAQTTVTSTTTAPASATTKPTSGKCGDNATWSYDASTCTLTVSGTGDMYEHSQMFDIPNWDDYMWYAKKIVIEEGITSVGSYDFEGFRVCESVSIPESVKSVGDFAFFYCKKLTSLTFPAGVESIGLGAFGSCDILSSITVMNSECDIFDQAIYKACDGVIVYGMSGSTAQAYAEKYGYTFAALDAEGLFGDANSDGLIDGADASWILYANANGVDEFLTPAQKAVSDINGDGLYDGVDASLILSYNVYAAGNGTDTLQVWYSKL